MAQDAGQDELEMVTLFSSSTHDAEMEADNVHRVLEANGIPSILVGPSVLPVVEFQVQVSRERAEEARRVVEEAQAAGPAAAAEAEAESETGA
jgi:hypothetical protein